MVLSRKLTRDKAKLYVVTAISNPCRYKSRYNLYRDFKKYVETSGAELITIEMAYGNRPFEITDSESLTNIQVRGEHEVWQKENLLNIALQFLPNDWEYVAWVDADVKFLRDDWVNETLHLLQRYSIIQMFSQAVDLLPNHELMQKHKGFIKSYYENNCTPLPYSCYSYGKYGHPGYAYAARRQSLDDLGGLIDFAILGSADNHMAHALVGQVDRTIPASLLNTGYGRELLEWQGRAERSIKRNVGYMEGTLVHYFHGTKKSRGYADRWKILTANNYDPDTDIFKDTQGLIRLSGNKILLRDQIKQYFSNRNEDTTYFDLKEVKI